ncbi:conserved hypothetical protein, secreted [Candidatus Thiomargarita nelsonii]|uniref:DUF4384 domain-containing protein n=1 Tax=Candidatus Thiomargarita nelsonii TaxID=1003181 RepID=A0A176S7B0_9GAMM|nr:conserved hypothetical protein, secreted [Candidatus Thiomargarita nelsonii]
MKRKILRGLFIAVFGIASEAAETDSPPPVAKKRGVDQTLTGYKPTQLLSFKIGYLYRAGGQGDFKHFRDGSVLHSGDHLKLIFTPTEDNIYIYIFMVDSHNNVARLFPTDKFKGAAKANKNPVKKSVKYFVPAKSKSFQLDNNTGEESIYLIATRQPDEVLEKPSKFILAKAKRRLIEPELVDDVPDNTPIVFIEDGKKFSVLPKYLKNMCEECVYRVTFQHH